MCDRYGQVIFLSTKKPASERAFSWRDAKPVNGSVILILIQHDAVVSDVLDDRAGRAGRHLVRAEIVLVKRRVVRVQYAVLDAAPVVFNRAVLAVVIRVEACILAPFIGIAADAFVIDIACARRARDDNRIADDTVGTDHERLRIDEECERRVLLNVEGQQVARLRQGGQRVDLVFLPFRLAVEQVGERAVILVGRRVRVRAAG